MLWNRRDTASEINFWWIFSKSYCIYHYFMIVSVVQQWQMINLRTYWERIVSVLWYETFSQNTTFVICFLRPCFGFSWKIKYVQFYCRKQIRMQNFGFTKLFMFLKNLCPYVLVLLKWPCMWEIIWNVASHVVLRSLPVEATRQLVIVTSCIQQPVKYTHSRYIQDEDNIIKTTSYHAIRERNLEFSI